MLSSGRVVAFAPSSNLDESVAFYRDKLGLELAHRDGFAAVFTSGNDTVRVALVGPFEPQRGTVVGWEVDDVRATAGWLASRGVPLERFEGMGQDELGIWNPPGGGAVGWFKDPGGNTLSISGHA